MPRVYRRLALLLLFSTILAAPQQGAWQAMPSRLPADTPPSRIDGVWALSLDAPHQSSFKFDNYLPDKKVVMIKTFGNDVQVSDPETNTTWTGKAHDITGFSFSLPVKTASTGNTKSVSFEGSVSGNTIFGKTKIDNVDVQWKAVRLLSVWECANHKNPSHIATTEEEIQSLTMQYKCNGWHKLK
jgi:hypothetical protein